MTDHPMSCYPGHFESWRPGRWMAWTVIAPGQRSSVYDGAELKAILGQDVVEATDRAITRMMSGQITTGGRDE